MRPKQLQPWFPLEKEDPNRQRRGLCSCGIPGLSHSGGMTTSRLRSSPTIASVGIATAAPSPKATSFLSRVCTCFHLSTWRNSDMSSLTCNSDSTISASCRTAAMPCKMAVDSPGMASEACQVLSEPSRGQFSSITLDTHVGGAVRFLPQRENTLRLPSNAFPLCEAKAFLCLRRGHDKSSPSDTSYVQSAVRYKDGLLALANQGSPFDVPTEIANGLQTMRVRTSYRECSTDQS